MDGQRAGLGRGDLAPVGPINEVRNYGRSGGPECGPGETGGAGGAAADPGDRGRGAASQRDGAQDLHTRHLQDRVSAMRASGMSATAVRRALGLTAREAVAAGLEVPAEWQHALARPSAPVAPAQPRYSADGRRRDLQMSDVLRAVSEATGIAPERLLGREQDRRHAGARHLLMYLLRELCAGASYPTIGFFVRRDHTTVLYGCRRARGLIEHDRAFRASYRRIRKALNA